MAPKSCLISKWKALGNTNLARKAKWRASFARKGVTCRADSMMWLSFGCSELKRGLAVEERARDRPREMLGFCSIISGDYLSVLQVT